MSKMGEELERRLDENKCKMYEALKLIAYFKQSKVAYDQWDAWGCVEIARQVLAKIDIKDSVGTESS